MVWVGRDLKDHLVSTPRYLFSETLTFIWCHTDMTTDLWETSAGLEEQLEAEGI